jgi:hypothetical protein
MTTSKYGVITITDLQTRTGRTYANYTAQSDSSRLYPDVTICSWITQAEVLVFANAGKTFTTPFSDAIVWSVTEIAKTISDNALIDDGIIQGRQPQEPLFTEQMLNMINTVNIKDNSIGRIKSICSAEDYNGY